LAEYQVAVCNECRYAVWPSQVKGHLQEQHKIQRREAEAVGEDVRSWPGLIQYYGELVLPSQIRDPIAELSLYDNGLLCQLEPARCRYIARSTESIRKHWREAHGWSAARKRGRPSRIQAQGVQAQVQEGCRQVYCQRFFTSRNGSQYFEVKPPVEDQGYSPEPVPVNSEVAWARVGKQMADAWENIKKRAHTTIENGEKDEVNPWLQRTGWLPYLIGLERPDLLASIKEPGVDPAKDEEPVEAAIWNAIGKLAQYSQDSVIERVGVFVRLEAIRTEHHQTRYQPLQPYMDEKAIIKHARRWQQIVMFFARTQREHEWNSPAYRFTRRQREAWEALIKQARRDVGGGDIDIGETDDEMEEVEADEMDDDEMDGDDEVDEVDEAIDEGGEHDEAGHDTGNRSQPGSASKPEGLSKLQKACLQFCIALLNQSITRKEYDSPLICALAVLGVAEDGWKGPELYPPVLSSTIKIARFMVIQQALELSEPFQEDEFDSDSAYESDNNSQPPPRRKGCLQFVKEMMDKFMVRGSHSPMQWMLDLRTYGMKIHYNTTTRGHVDWKGQDELLYKELHFSMAQFRSMVHGLVTESRRLLIEELLFCSIKDPANQAPRVPWESMRDNPTDGRPGWNFLQDHRTRMPVDGKIWLFDRVGQDSQIRDRFLKPASRSGVDRAEAERYMDRIIEFREKLAVLMHIVGGQPGRGPELLSIRHSNTIQGGHRNIFIEDGLMVYATRYHKGYAMSGDIKIIHRYIPREAGELLVWYMWLVLPFQQQLEALVWEKEVISSHLWPADPSGRKWTSDRLREVLKRESIIGLGQALTIQSYRDIAIGISRRFMRGSTAFGTDDGDENKEWDQENAAAITADLQAGHTAHVAGLIYGRGIMEMAGAVANKRQQFRISSIDWHRFLGFQSATDEVGHTYKKRKLAPFESEAVEGQFDRRWRLKKMDAASQLRRMMGGNAVFRGIQEEAITSITSGESPIVAVMPTGAGKSLLFMLPAWAEQGGTTIVVVPLIALRGDMKRRCKALGISCAEWQGRRPPDAAAVVLVTPESAVSEDFMTFLNRLKATRQLDRIVIDECHVVLNRQYTFRKQMQQLGRLVTAGTQMILLTATLPPSEEMELYQRMHFSAVQVKMIRASTTRINVRYQVIKVEGSARQDDRDKAVLTHIQQRLDRTKTGKAVIYGNTVGKVKRIAQALGCNAYYHDAAGKAIMLQDFMDGKQRVIVATSALGMGVDIPDIRQIIHVDRPRTILDYAQESGRAGRDGLPSEACMIITEEADMDYKDGQTEDEGELVRQYIDGGEDRIQVCRRAVLDRYLDGREDRTTCEEGEEACDVCREDRESTEDVASREDVDDEGTDREEIECEFQQQERQRQGPQDEFIRSRQQEMMDVEGLRQQLRWWAGRCGICEAAHPGQSLHDVRNCWRIESRKAAEMVKMIEGQIKFEAFSGCFWCGVPQAICNQWEDNGKGRYQRTSNRGCQYIGVLVSGVVGMIFGYKEKVWEHWRGRLQEAGVNLDIDKDFIRYLGQKRGMDTVESNRLVEEFCWIAGLVANSI
jgi:superfamily II DNA helicase RecQ